MATDYKVLLFGGTDEGHKIAEYLADRNIPSLVCVATEYGEKMLSKRVNARCGRLNREEMTALMKNHRFALCIDATHPYAEEVSANISAASEETGLSIYRVVRKQSVPEYGTLFKSLSEIVEYLSYKEGNVFVTTGSKEIAAFSPLGERVFARVLPDAQVIKTCNEAGFSGRQLICMQGPFSAELNAALLRETNAKFLVTKESGKQGGFEEKIRAARETGAKALILERPSDEDGIDFDEIFEIIEKNI